MLLDTVMMTIIVQCTRNKPIMLSVIMLSVIMLRVVMLTVVSPYRQCTKNSFTLSLTV